MTISTYGSIADYALESEVCRIGETRLYRAGRGEEQVLLKVPVAGHGDASLRARLRHEYSFLSSSDAEQFMRPHALIDDADRFAVVYRNFAGTSLNDLLSLEQLDWQTCLDIAIQLTVPLAALHQAQLIHGGLHPLNILVNGDRSQIRLADLGMTSNATDSPDGGRFRAAEEAGDLAYYSPEQTGRMSRAVDYRTDFYSLGILLYRMLTGRLPFEANDPLEWVHCHIARLPRCPAEVAPDIPVTVSDIVMKLLAKLPEDRYQSMSGLRHDLEHCLHLWRTSGGVAPFRLGKRDHHIRFQVSQKLYGRAKELIRLTQAFERLSATGRPELMLVSGYSGVGKSLLVRELRRPVIGRRGYFISGKFDQYKTDIPYLTITQAFRELVQQILSESEERVAMWRQKMLEALGINGQLIVNVIPQVELIIGPQPPVLELSPLDTQKRFQSVFERFVHVFAQSEHPLVLFLDDLQWADVASLNLLEHVLLQPKTEFLFAVATFRDNEIAASHPLLQMRDRLKNAGLPVEDIALAPLSLASLNRLVGDALLCHAGEAASLSQLVHEKTAGNPFFVIQFLTQLYKDGHITCDDRSSGWQWDVARIAAYGYTVNVVELMLEKLRKLPDATRRAVELAACMGNAADAATLALICPQDEEDIHRDLAVAVREGLMQRQENSYMFLHDRIRQAAYMLVPETERPRIHLMIGRQRWRNTSPDRLGEALFDIASHFLSGAAQLAGDADKTEAARLFLQAARRARATTAYPVATNYLKTARDLLDPWGWTAEYQLHFDLHLELAECQLLEGDFSALATLLDTLQSHARTNLSKLAVYNIQTRLHTILGEFEQSIDTGLNALRVIGVHWVAHPTFEQAQQQYLHTWDRLNGRDIGSMTGLPQMTDREAIAAMEIASVLVDAAGFTDANLLTLVGCFMVESSLGFGNAESSALGYAVFGLVSEHLFGRYQEGYRFGRLAFDLIEQNQVSRFTPKVCLFVGHLTNFCVQPYRSGIRYLDLGIRSGTQIGDRIWTSYNHAARAMLQFIGGEPLPQLDEAVAGNVEAVHRAKFDELEDLVLIVQRCVRNLRGLTDGYASLNGDGFDERVFEENSDRPRSSFLMNWYYISKMQICVLQEDFAEALLAGERVQAGLAIHRWYATFPEHYFYHALSLAACFDDLPAERRGAVLDTLADYDRKYQEWAESCPENFACKQALIAAEIARLQDRRQDAMMLYEKAIRTARDSGATRNLALAYETASRFYRKHHFDEFADAYLRQARSGYAQWGAEGKVRHLDARYPQLLSHPGIAIAYDNGLSQLDALSAVKAMQAISGEIVIDKLLDTLMRIVMESAGARKALLVQCNGGEPVLAARAQVLAQEVQVALQPRDDPASALPASILNYLVRTRERVLIDDAAQPNPFAEDPYFARCQPRSVLCLPIIRQSELAGVLYLENDLAAGAFTPARLSTLELLAAQAAISLQNALLYADLRKENSERLRAEKSLREKEMRIRRLVDSNIIGIFFWTLEGVITDANEAFLQVIGYSREELQAGKINWSTISARDYRAADERAVDELLTTGSCTPYEKEYVHKNGKRIPILVGGALLEGSHNLGVGFVLDLSERKRAEEKVRYMAHHDALTGLPNRVLLRERIQHAILQARRPRTSVAVLFVDLDRFKHINDSLGHLIGDRLLSMVSQRMRDCLRREDTVARVGGDEFVICLCGLNNGAAAGRIAQKLLESLDYPFLVDEHKLHVTASIGISLYPDDGSDVDSLMRTADTALYHAKEMGRGNFQFFTRHLSQIAERRLTLENQLRQALDMNEFALHFQPQVDIETGEVFAAEALLRWRRGGQAPVSCGEFIGIAEESGLILPIGNWVLREACRQLAIWRAGFFPGMTMAVNLSARQFHQPDFARTIVQVLDEFNLPPTALDLEITETMIMPQSEDNLATLHQLSAMGIQLSVDDFGTGYSSLSYLQRFPVHALKIDRSFVDGIGEDSNDTALVTTIIAMARSLHLKVLAEGVESRAQADFLLEHGCRLAQGFYYGKPVPADAFEELHARRSQRSRE